MDTRNLRILIVSPEVVPFAKTGGLADVAGALPKALSRLGHEVKVILPKYKMVDESKFRLSEIKTKFPELSIAGKERKISVKSDQADFPPVEYLFLVNDEFYNRDELYRNRATGFDYVDNDERFIYFARGVLEIIKTLDWKPDVIHGNDWQSALLPAYLKTLYGNDSFFKSTATLFSIHNLAYQGNFPPSIRSGCPKICFIPPVLLNSGEKSISSRWG